MKLQWANSKFNRIAVALLLAALCWGLFLRLYALADPSFWIDEAFSVEIASALVRGDIEFYQFLGVGRESFRGPIYHGFLSLLFKVFGESEWVARIPSAIAGFLLILVCSGFCYRVWGKHAAIITVVLMSFSYWQITWSRQTREYIFVTLLIWLAIYLINEFWPLRRKAGLKIATVLSIAAIALGVHMFGLIVLVAAYYRVLADWLVNGTKSKKIYSVFAALSGLAVSLMALRYAFGAKPGNLDIYAGFLWQSYWPLILPGVFCPLWRGNPKHLEISLWLILVLVFVLALYAFGLPTLSLRYTFVVAPVFIILAAVTLSRLRFLKWAYIVILAVVGGVLLKTDSITLKPNSHYLLETYKVEGGINIYSPQPRFREAYQYIESELGEINLITPYPAVSRRYRAQDDIMALNIMIPFGDSDVPAKYRTEPYTGLHYASASAMMQLATQLGDIYVLLDRMAIRRLDSGQKIVFKQYGERVMQWRKPPNSHLYLYRIRLSE